MAQGAQPSDPVLKLLGTLKKAIVPLCCHYRYFTRGRPGPTGVKWAKFQQENGPYLQDHALTIVTKSN